MIFLYLLISSALFFFIFRKFFKWKITILFSALSSATSIQVINFFIIGYLDPFFELAFAISFLASLFYVGTFEIVFDRY